MQSHVTLLGKDTILVISLTLVFKGLCVWGEILLPCFGKIKSLKSCICLAVPQVRFSYVIYCIYIWEARKESRQWKRVISNSWEQCSVLWAENKKKIYLQTRNDVLTKGDGREMGCYGGGAWVSASEGSCNMLLYVGSSSTGVCVCTEHHVGFVTDNTCYGHLCAITFICGAVVCIPVPARRTVHVFGRRRARTPCVWLTLQI